MYNSHTTYFVLASIFLSFFWSSHLQTPSNLLWCFGCFIGEVWCGTTRRDTRQGHAVFSLHSCDVFLFWMEQNIQHQKTVVTGCLKSSEIFLTCTRMILTLDSKIWVSVPHLTWKPVSAGVRYLQRGRNVQLGPFGGKQRFRFFTWKSPMKPPKG